MLDRRDGHTHVELFLLHRNLKLRRRHGHAVRAPQQMVKVGGRFRTEDLAQRRADHGCTAVGPEHATKSHVAVGHTPLRAQRKHAGGNIFQDGFNVPATLFQLCIRVGQSAGGFVNFLAAGLQLRRHIVERRNQLSQLIGGRDLYAMPQVPNGNLPCRLGQGLHRASYQLGYKQRKPRCDEEHQHGKQREQQHIQAADALGLTAQSLVITLVLTDLRQRRREVRGQRKPDQDLSGLARRSRSQKIFGVQIRPFLRRRLDTLEIGKRPTQHGPGTRRVPTGHGIAVTKGQSESALKGGLVTAELMQHSGVIRRVKGMLDVRRFGNLHRLLQSVVTRVRRKQSGDPAGVLLQRRDRAGEPFVDRAVHQPVREHEHHQRGSKGKHQSADDHARAEARTKYAELAFRIELEQVAEQHEGEDNQQQENQRRERDQPQCLFSRVRPKLF